MEYDNAALFLMGHGDWPEGESEELTGRLRLHLVSYFVFTNVGRSTSWFSLILLEHVFYSLTPPTGLFYE